ncbi:3-deoxy-D-manno-octulosonate 8-phosphate phosphatase, YrbI family [Chloroherpeton thalassium ATCC 35110]|uniref:3-deoxy-D-manno-octulosonate 8-phosphate phosphatase, YrbI family n=1 Tax=Chloroherpeton thalassium (strain ATCC 35110 / GB-78) TaxID=517418 RepID=B3QV90_CHLT3|nr:HAD hydrolase family protein [Chloroherpeton thalassium]ACF13044.1 3-deoxy-D-manno-octulosonate 8-phosphate phosphatase, YrbI family [Chloroherpeton thalassium ATCC 35110]
MEIFGVSVSSEDPTSRLRQLLGEIKVIIFTIDGVFTDGQISYSESGEEVRTFHARDGFAIQEALAKGMNIAVVSERESKAARKRLEEIGVTDITMGVKDKMPTYEAIKARYGVSDAECVYIGDDVMDLPLFEKVGVSITPLNGVEYLRNRVYYVSGYEGGKGCVRDVIEMVLAIQGKWKYYEM